MEDTPTIAAIRRFLLLLEAGAPPSNAELARALDELAMAYHEAPDGSPADDDRDPPGDDDIRTRRDRLGERFPDYGYYSFMDPLAPFDQDGLVGDAIDDLDEIAHELEDVIWRFENIGPDDAHWQFKFGYGAHWGRHLRELSLYLHAKIW